MSKPGGAKKLGPEDLLGPELETALRGGKPTTGEFQRHELVESLGTGESQNWPPLAAATRLLLAVKQSERDASRAEWLAYFAKSRRMWMGSEVGTRIYWSFFLVAVGAVYLWAKRRGDKDLQAEAAWWLVQWWAFVLACLASNGHVLIVGNRSAGHSTELPDGGPDPGFLEFALALARGEDTGPAFAAMKRAGWGPLNRWEYRCLLLVREAMIDTLAMVQPGQIPDAGMMCEYHLIRSERGLAVWIEDDVNGNTDPVLGAIELDGVISWLPAHGGIASGREFRNQAGLPESCKRSSDGALLVYDSEIFGHDEKPVPPGDEYAFGGVGGARRLVRPAGAPISAPATTPAPTPESPAPPATPPQDRPRKPWWKRIFR